MYRDNKKLKANQEKHKPAIIRRANARRDAIRAKINKYKHEHPCLCGESHPAALDFHHVRDDKEFCIGRAYSNGYAWHRIEAEISKCEVICRNCHAKLHWHVDFKMGC